MTTRRNFPARVKARKDGADKRAEARATLGDAGQLARLERAGLDKGKEAKRLRAKLKA